MGIVVSFTDIKNTPKPVPAKPGTEVILLSRLCLAVSYYVMEGGPDTANDLMKHINCYAPYSGGVEVPAGIARLVNAMDIGKAVMS